MINYFIYNIDKLIIIVVVAIAVIGLALFLKSKRRRRRLRFYINFILYKIGLKDHIERSDLARVHVMESYEPLVDVINHPKIIYDEKTIERPLLLRKNVLVKIHKVADKLPDGVYLKIYSAYRSRIEVYEKWKAIVDELTKENPQMGRAQILSLAKFKAPNPKSLGGHETGGAIDVALCDANGEELDFGTYYHESSAANKTHSKLITKEQRYNRKMLLKLMKSQNFVNNPYQWWHFSYGDNVWAAYKGKRVGGAIYDAAEKEFENVGYVRIVQTVITSLNPKQ